MTYALAAGPDVVVVGSLNLDLVVRAPRLPRPGETLIGSDFATDEGGKGANQAVAAARMGARVAMIGRLGRDAHGARLRAALQLEGVDDAGVGDDDARPTGVASIVVATGGENCIVVVPGANHALQPRHVEACAALLAAARIAVLQFEIPMPAVIAALQHARTGGATTLLNAAPAADLATTTFALVDWLVVNQEEAG
ncbi:MAG TPA: PfkB family carbohydrate kinase, partial [Burkholderiaceae bacterium]|nr:PfkB family carbohydrate kinase [Burkholderiaceae bacterium]